MRRKISRVSGTPDHPVEHPFEYANTFVREQTTGGPDRLKIGLRDGPDIEAFVTSFGEFIAQDARHDVWLQSFTDGGPIVVDRYNMVYAYGPLDHLAQLLTRGGVQEVAPWAAPKVPYPHALHYHSEFNAAEAAVLSTFPWYRKPLQPRDVQFRSGLRADFGVS